MGKVKQLIFEDSHYEDLEKAVMFGVGDGDLVGQSFKKEPIWIERWRQKFHDSDYMPEDSGEYCE